MARPRQKATICARVWLGLAAETQPQAPRAQAKLLNHNSHRTGCLLSVSFFRTRIQGNVSAMLNHLAVPML